MKYPEIAKGVGAGLLIMVFSGCSTPAQKSSNAAPVEWDGLQRVQIKGLDYAYTRPGADLASYNKIMVDPLQIAFSKDRRANGGKLAGGFPIGERDREVIRKALADIIYAAFVQEVQDKGGYQIVTEPGPDVLHLAGAIVDLDIAAPDRMSAGRSYVITASKGSMTLAAELRDSETGELLARAIDRATDNSSFRWEWANSVTNAQAARTLATRWARILREELDAARRAGTAAPPND